MLNIRMLAVWMLLSVFCCPLMSHAQPDEAAMLATAKGHFQDGGYYYASTWLERILRNSPKTAQREEILVMLAKSYAATGREEKAARAVRTLLKDYPQAAAKLDQDMLKLAQESYAETPPLAASQAAEASAPAPVASAVPAASATAQLTEAVTPPSAGAIKAPVAVAVTAPAQSAASGQAIPDVAKQNVAPAAATVPDEVKAPVKAEAPVKADVAAPAVAIAATPGVAETAKPAVALVATPAVVQVAVAPSAPASPVVVPVDALNAGETETACRDNSATVPGTYAIELGEFIGKNSLVRAKKAVKKAGLVPVVAQGRQKVAVMLRILMGEYHDEAAAKKMLNKLRKAGAECFMLKDKGRTFRVYAGSYFEHQAALDEQKRLLAQGLDSELREATVTVSTYLIDAGCFPTDQAAKGKLAELERLGLKGKVLPPQ